MHQYLAVCERKISRARIAARYSRARAVFKTRACELPVRKLNPFLSDRFHHPGKEIVAHLVSESPGTAMHHDGDLIFEYSHSVAVFSSKISSMKPISKK